jgi:hypothetical protein
MWSFVVQFVAEGVLLMFSSREKIDVRRVVASVVVVGMLVAVVVWTAR